MTPRTRVTLVVLLGFLSPSLIGAADLDVTRVLVGTWDGEVQMASGSYPRKLVIHSLQAAGGTLRAVAEYGGTGKDYGATASDYGGGDVRLLPVAVTVQSFGNDVLLRFQTIEAWTVELKLYKDERHLFGNLEIPISRGAWPLNPMRLTKVQ
jgi:hypothetical protein